MYGDDYKPSDPQRYAAVEQFFGSQETREQLRAAVVIALMDKTMPREELHVLHKRTCLKKGWEEMSWCPRGNRL